MSRAAHDCPVWALTAPPACAVACFALVCTLGTQPGGRAGAMPAGAEQRAVSALRCVLGSQFYGVADVNFHKGVTHSAPGVDRFPAVRRLMLDIAPTAHAHLEGEGVTEMMPWLRLATWADPGNVDVYLDTAYFLAAEAGRPDAAEQVLREAARNNPGDYEVRQALGRLYLRTGRREQAARAYGAGLRLWPGARPPDEAGALLDRREMLVCRGLLHEMAGENAAALDRFREAVRIDPNARVIRERIAALERGEAPAVPAPRIWGELLKRRYTHVCEREEEARAGRAPETAAAKPPAGSGRGRVQTVH